MVRLTSNTNRGTKPPVAAPVTEIQVADLTIDTEQKVARIGERPVGLTPLEYRLLELLARHSGIAVSRSAALDQLYGNIAPEPKVIDVVVRNIRIKLMRAGESKKYTLYIESVHGVGYKLSAPKE